LDISASDFSWRKSASRVFVFACASCTLRITSSSESGFGARAADAGTETAAAQSASVRNFLIDLLITMGCPNAPAESPISG